jgi:hypothetical protein
MFAAHADEENAYNILFSIHKRTEIGIKVWAKNVSLRAL